MNTKPALFGGIMVMAWAGAVWAGDTGAQIAEPSILGLMAAAVAAGILAYRRRK